ncbi:MAG: hypothetical protein RR945_10815 [Erysipelotrichaceae bacterium]
MRNEKGSTLVWVMGVILILLIVVGGSLSLAINYQSRTIENSKEQQVYHSAYAISDILVKEINENNSVLIPKGSEKIEIEQVNLPQGMGSGSVVIERVKTFLYVYINATYQDYSYDLFLTMEKDSSNEWVVKHYENKARGQS